VNTVLSTLASRLAVLGSVYLILDVASLMIILTRMVS
jgi:hypothetical protein